VSESSFTVFCFGAVPNSNNLEVQKNKSLELVRSRLGHNYRRQGTLSPKLLRPPPPLRCHGARCEWLENLDRPDLSFPPWTSLMHEPNLPAQKGAVPVLPRTSV
jgi:hypothetical protein